MIEAIKVGADTVKRLKKLEKEDEYGCAGGGGKVKRNN